MKKVNSYMLQLAVKLAKQAIDKGHSGELAVSVTSQTTGVSQAEIYKALAL